MAIDRLPPNETPSMQMGGKKKLKRIDAHTKEELDIAIAKAVDKFGQDFWLLLHGIDAYMERRKRRDADKMARIKCEIEAAYLGDENSWGDN